MINDIEQFVNRELAGKQKYSKETLLQYDLTWDQTQATMVGSIQLTS
jgi:hypothetical protein